MRRTDPHDLWACPECHTKLALEDRFLVCDKCARRYPIDDHGIPHLLISEGDKHRRPKE